MPNQTNLQKYNALSSQPPNQPEGNANINEPDESGQTLLHHAASKGDTSKVKSLLEQKANVNVMNHQGDTPAMVAIKMDHPDIAIQLCDYSYNVNLANLDGDTLICLATKLGKFGVIQHIKKIATTPLLKMNSTNDRTLLMLAARRGHLNIVQELLKSRCFDINGRSLYQDTALTCALEHWILRPDNRTDMIDYLLSQKADINQKNGFGHMALNKVVVKVNNIEKMDFIVKYLCEKKADVNTKDANGESFLMSISAKMIYNLSGVMGPQHLLMLCGQEGADLCSINNENLSLLTDCAIRISQAPYYACHPDVIGVLCEAKADVNAAADRDHLSPLMAAASVRPLNLDLLNDSEQLGDLKCDTFHRDTVILSLLQKKADPAQKNREGKDIFDIIKTHIQFNPFVVWALFSRVSLTLFSRVSLKRCSDKPIQHILPWLHPFCDALQKVYLYEARRDATDTKADTEKIRHKQIVRRTRVHSCWQHIHAYIKLFDEKYRNKFLETLFMSLFYLFEMRRLISGSLMDQKNIETVFEYLCPLGWGYVGKVHEIHPGMLEPCLSKSKTFRSIYNIAFPKKAGKEDCLRKRRLPDASLVAPSSSSKIRRT